MLVMKVLGLFILISFSQLCLCQNDSSITKNTTVEVIKDHRIDKLNNVYISSFKLKGYRIQIFSGTKKQPARQIRGRFIQQYKYVNAHEIYQQPYYKIRVGDFVTKLEALKFLKEISPQFPNSFIVQDDINHKIEQE